jgi:hypothetical protein
VAARPRRYNPRQRTTAEGREAMEGFPIGRSSAAVQFAVGQLRAVVSAGGFLTDFHLDIGAVPGGPR